MTGDGVTDGAVCLAFLQEGLRPQRRPGQRLMLDHLRAHQGPGVAAAGAAAGVRLRYRPPYAPDFSPIEACWSKVKTRLRTKAARTLAALAQAIAEARGAITSQEAHGWFAHAGYCVVSN
jgi:transposase